MSRGRAARAVLPILCLLGFVVFAALGAWQVERLRWKLDLIDRVERRLAAPATEFPAPGYWPTLDSTASEYRRVKAIGIFRHDRETLVEALTERGAGFWVMTPLDTRAGTVLVNRGFVPGDRADPRTRAAGQVKGLVEVEGLVRLSEPGGRFLRPNRPGTGRWYSRDVAAIASARGLGPVAPVFIDAGPAPNPGGLPVGGMTVVRFRNAHLIYALTWFALAAMALAGLALSTGWWRRSGRD